MPKICRSSSHNPRSMTDTHAEYSRRKLWSQSSFNNQFANERSLICQRSVKQQAGMDRVRVCQSVQPRSLSSCSVWLAGYICWLTKWHFLTIRHKLHIHSLQHADQISGHQLPLAAQAVAVQLWFVSGNTGKHWVASQTRSSHQDP